MGVSWKKGQKGQEKYRPEMFIALVDEQVKPQTGGGHIVDGYPFIVEDAAVYLLSTLVIHPEPPESTRFSLIQRALLDPKEEGKRLDKKVFIEGLQRLHQQWVKEPETDFVVATGLSFRPFPRLKRRTIGGLPILFTKSLPSGFRDARAALGKAVTQIRDFDLPSGYTAVRIHVRGRSGNEATERALLAIDYLRGLWNLGLPRPLLYSDSSLYTRQRI